MSATESGKPVFLSYRRADDQAPPWKPKAEGYVKRFVRELSYELGQAGVQPESVWVDRNEIELADKFTRVIAAQIEKTDVFLAILSNGYVSSGCCTEELNYFASRWGMSNDDLNGRIFLVYKHGVREEELPKPLRGLQAIQLYEKDPETGLDAEFFDRGRIVKSKPYQQAVKLLASRIRDRLKDLGRLGLTGGFPEPLEAKLEVASLAGDRMSIYVARPAFDMEEAYSALVADLTGHGHTVVPQAELPTEGEQTLAMIRSSLAKAEFSIHLLGDRKGFQPAELSTPTVALQLAEAAQEVARRPAFQRLIWAPRVVPYRSDPEIRDPLRVLSQLDATLPSDEIVGDTLARFNDFVFQRIRAMKAVAVRIEEPPPARAPHVYVTASPLDSGLVKDIAKLLRTGGARPQASPKDAGYVLASRCDHIVFCWDKATEADVFDALERLDQSDWRRLHPSGKLILLTFDGDNESQALACDLDSFGSATSVMLAADAAAIVELIGEQAAC